MLVKGSFGSNGATRIEDRRELVTEQMNAMYTTFALFKDFSSIRNNWERFLESVGGSPVKYFLWLSNFECFVLFTLAEYGECKKCIYQCLRWSFKVNKINNNSQCKYYCHSYPEEW